MQICFMSRRYMSSRLSGAGRGRYVALGRGLSILSFCQFVSKLHQSVATSMYPCIGIVGAVLSKSQHWSVINQSIDRRCSDVRLSVGASVYLCTSISTYST